MGARSSKNYPLFEGTNSIQEVQKIWDDLEKSKGKVDGEKVGGIKLKFPKISLSKLKGTVLVISEDSTSLKRLTRRLLDNKNLTIISGKEGWRNLSPNVRSQIDYIFIGKTSVYEAKNRQIWLNFGGDFKQDLFYPLFLYNYHASNQFTVLDRCDEKIWIYNLNPNPKHRIRKNRQ